MKIIKLSVVVAAIFSSFSIQAQDPSQSVFVNGTPKGMLGSPVSITVGYDVTDADATLTGLGLRVHYDSSALEFVEFANVLTTDNISSDGPSDDVDNLDGDTSTDKFITANWASLFGSWPGSLPSDLLTATFNVADDDSLESTVINFSEASNAAGYLFAPNSYTLDIIGGSWDFDGNGTVDALTDGLLMLRHSFNLRGNGLIDGAVAIDSTFTHEQIEANLTAAYQIADIDDNGAVDALTDGLMLLRYMFNLRGEQLVNQTVAEDAARTTHAEIEQYIGSFMPSDDSGDTGSGDTGSGDTGSGDTGSGDTGSGDTGSGDTGSGDTGSGDSGSGDTGSGDTGSGDTGSGTEKGPAQFTEAFGGTTIDGELFTFPAAAESWAGFANMDLELYPFVFSGGGSITFTAAVPSGGSADVKFRFEKNPHPDVDPSYETSTVTISGATESSYSVNIPSQGGNTFRNLIMYVVDRDLAVQVSNLIVTEISNPDTGDAGDTGGAGNAVEMVKGPASFIESFGDTIFDGDIFTFPSNAKSWGGFANMDLDLYPFSFVNGGSIEFTGSVPSNTAVKIKFRFEKDSHPNHEPLFETGLVTVSCNSETTYRVNFPSQGNKGFNNLIMYVLDFDVPVQISNLMVTQFGETGAGDLQNIDGAAVSCETDSTGGSGDTGSGNTGSGDTGSGDTGSGDTGSGDTGSGDTGSGGTGSGGTGSGGTGSGDTGSGDTGSGDTGSGDTGSGDTGSGDTGSGGDDFVTETVGPANFIEDFGGTVIEGDEFTHPSSAESWAGIANMDLSLYPFNFADGGSISFTGAVPSDGSANVKFKFEFKPSPDVEPSYTTEFETISGSADQTYTIQIPSQGIKTFSNLILYIQERDTTVKIANLMVTTTVDPSGGNGIDAPDDYNTLSYGAGSIGDAIYPSNHRCKSDYGYWVENAGVISTDSAVQALGCNQGSGIPTGNITKLYPQLTGPAASKPTQTHKWWGSISFLGEMTVGDYDDSAYITPDPISARINNKGARVGGIPSGLRVTNPGQYYYPIGDHAAEVFDGIAVGNSDYSNLEAYTKDHSEGSVTVLWKSGSTDVMEATFVHGSPYVYFKAYAGNLEVRTLRQDGVGEKGTFSTPSNMLGIWTNVAGAINNFLIVGEGSTSFPDLSSNKADPMTMGTNGVINSAKEMTLVYLPHLTAGSVSSSMINQFASAARNKVAAVNIDYAVDSSNNEVTVTHSYVDEQGAAVDTIAGMHPLHWKNASQATTPYQIRSARGTIKFAELSQFSYQIPYVGVLPTMPTIDGSFDQATLAGLVTDFVNQGSNVWNTSADGDLYEDTYWSGKNYGKVAEVSAIARSIGMTAEANDMIDWLKAELSDWFSSEADGVLKTKKYFVYDSDWNTLLGFDEAYGSHQRLADHHFHYGYFVRAAAEICRVDLAWCGQDQYGPMIELLIRDYAADKDDPMFPHMRNFDPANGFSWADGKINFIRGNNNESTSEAATAYGAIVLYGLATGNTELTEKGMYLHASTGATYWEYWNNIDGYNNISAEANNFFPGYAHITTSIIWGDGVDFATWFSGAYAHILGIQGLPSSPLIFHVGLHADYMEDYVNLGLSESSNNKPSGLVDDQWRDLWWNLWAMTDAQAAIADYNSVSSYDPEQGESKAHTYHWIHTFDELGHLATGTGEITANHPAAIAFDKNGTKSYVVYNFTDQTIPVTFKQGNTVIHTMNATPFGFTVE